VFDRRESIYVDDGKLRQDFALLAVDTGSQRRKLAKYVLARLEQDLSGRACDPDTDPGTIEHILPENPSDEWANDFAREYWDSSIYRVGNLTLLEAKANRDIGGALYPTKRAAYERSTYALTRQMPETAPEHWTPEILEARQMRLAQRAVHLWRVDFA
jgi:hypothetical protein